MTELPDRLLRDVLHDAASTTPSPICVDADALASWADGTMGRTARAAFEAHAAACARCQALMAAMARTEPPTTESPWWRRSVFAWIVPLAAASAAAVIVVNVVMSERGVPAPASQVARTESAPRDLVLPSPAPPATASPEMTAKARAATRRQQEPAIDTTRTQDAVAKKTQPGGAGAPPATANVDPPAKGAVASPSALPVPAPPPPAAAANTAQPAPAAGAAVLAAPPSGFRAEEKRLDSTADSATSRMLSAKARVPIVIVSPDRDSQWRIVDGKVEHTEDGGVTWRPQPLGIAAAVRAGAAPAARICWLVGSGGVVLLTTDGAPWRRIDFPESVDLVSIQASDASHATVTSAAGRTFSTGDGGRSWTSR
jgi:Putative zinc-finger